MPVDVLPLEGEVGVAHHVAALAENYWEVIQEGFEVLPDKHGKAYIINGILVSHRQHIPCEVLQKHDADYTRRARAADLVPVAEHVNDTPTSPALRNSVIAKTSQPTPPPQPLPEHLWGLARPPWHEFERQAPMWYWRAYTKAMWNVHRRHWFRFVNYVGDKVPFAGQWRDFSRYTSEWRKACFQTNRHSFAKMHFYQIRFGHVFRMFNAEWDLHAVYDNINEAYGTAALMEASQMQRGLSDEGRVGNFLAAGRTINPDRFFDVNGTYEVIQSQYSTIITDLKTNDQGQIDGFRIEGPAHSRETSWRPSKKNPRGAMWLSTLTGINQQRVQEIIDALPKRMRLVFDLYYMGFVGDPNREPLSMQQIAWLLHTNKGDVQKTIARIQKRFNDADLPCPLPAREKDQHADLRFLQDLNIDSVEEQPDMTEALERAAAIDAKLAAEFKKERAELIRRKEAEKRALTRFLRPKTKNSVGSYLHVQHGFNRYSRQNRHRKPFRKR